MEESPSKKRRKATFREVGPSLSKDELIRRLKVNYINIHGSQWAKSMKKKSVGVYF